MTTSDLERRRARRRALVQRRLLVLARRAERLTDGALPSAPPAPTSLPEQRGSGGTTR